MKIAIRPRIKNIFKKNKKLTTTKKSIKRIWKNIMWFVLGGVLGFFFFVSFLYIIYQKTHTDRVYEGVIVHKVDMSGKTKEEVAAYFKARNAAIQDTNITISSPQAEATLSARQVQFGYDADLLANQALSIGRSADTLSNISLMYQAFTHDIILPASYTFSDQNFEKITADIIQKSTIDPIDPLFNFKDNKVVTLREGKDGQEVDKVEVKQAVLTQLKNALETGERQSINMDLPMKKILAAVAEDKANSLGIKEEIGTGKSSFKGSIENRAFNINLAASKLNGMLIKPGETFSFNKTVGDISSLNGYKQAYVIQNGKTVLGDGGGVCQVSTTLFRAALQSGLPIVERNPHAYRVGYYEQDSAPGVDAAIYSPTVDLRFKNDTAHHILIQTYVDLSTQEMHFTLYGTKDDRQVSIGKPIVLSESPAPEPLYQDDPNMPKGEVKQIDFAAPGANVYFTRVVTKDGKEYLSDKFTSHYRPWQAVYMKGTKE